jgi:multidrug resistance efflux pump
MKKRGVVVICVVLALAVAGFIYRAPLSAFGNSLYASQVAPRLAGAAGAISGGPAGGALLAASGTIEADDTLVSSPVGGRLTVEPVAEGDVVKAGEVVAELDTSLNGAELAQAQAQVRVAQAQVALLKAGARPADIDVARAAVQQAQAARDASYTSWQDAVALVTAPGDLDVKIAEAGASVNAGANQLQAAQAAATSADLETALWSRTVPILQKNESVNVGFPNGMVFRGGVGPVVVGDAFFAWNMASQNQWQAHAQAGIAAANLAAGRQELADLQAQKADPLTLQAQADTAEGAFQMAEAALGTAQANLGVVLAGSPPEQISAAEAQAAEAQAGIAPLQVQRGQLTVSAPITGTVTALLLRRGEVAGPGTPILELADLGQATLTVYVPEPEIGRVHLSQNVLVAADSFPGRWFAGSVTEIADKAEYTPKNVETNDQRANTVYGVKITLADQEGALKQGMPADAYFCDSDAAPASCTASLAHASAGSGGASANVPASAQPAGGAIQASGTVEGDEFNIAAELEGRVVQVAAEEGDSVRAGQVLVRQDTSQLEAQYAQAGAAVSAAQAELARVVARPQPARVSQAQAQVAQAQAALAAARRVLVAAEQVRADPQDLDTQIDSATAQLQTVAGQVDLARANLKAAQVQQQHAPQNGSDETKTTRAMYDQEVAAEQAALQAAQAQMDGTQATLASLQAILAQPVALDAGVHQAQGQVLQASAAVTVALAAEAQTEAPAQPEAVALARAQIAQAQAAASLLQTTLARLQLTSPITGTVMSKIVHEGEVAQPGEALLTLVDLTRVKLTVYVPESRIGQVKLGERAGVAVDAYPGRAFHGTVTRINDQAEFTPKNVETQEERVNTVFAVEISLDNPDGALKPGMPAVAVLQ